MLELGQVTRHERLELAQHIFRPRIRGAQKDAEEMLAVQCQQLAAEPKVPMDLVRADGADSLDHLAAMALDQGLCEIDKRKLPCPCRHVHGQMTIRERALEHQARSAIVGCRAGHAPWVEASAIVSVLRLFYAALPDSNVLSCAMVAVHEAYRDFAPRFNAAATVQELLDSAPLVPTWALRLRLVRSLVLGDTLYHELGHHIHAQQQPEHRERETVADEWQTRLLRVHVRRRHPMARVVLWLPARLARLLRRGPTRQPR